MTPTPRCLLPHHSGATSVANRQPPSPRPGDLGARGLGVLGHGWTSLWAILSRVAGSPVDSVRGRPPRVPLHSNSLPPTGFWHGLQRGSCPKWRKSSRAVAVCALRSGQVPPAEAPASIARSSRDASFARRRLKPARRTGATMRAAPTAVTATDIVTDAATPAGSISKVVSKRIGPDEPSVRICRGGLCSTISSDTRISRLIVRPTTTHLVPEVIGTGARSSTPIAAGFHRGSLRGSATNANAVTASLGRDPDRCSPHPHMMLRPQQLRRSRVGRVAR